MINTIDALLVAQYIDQLDPTIWLEAADTNCNGEIDPDDAVLISNYSTQTLDEFPCSPCDDNTGCVIPYSPEPYCGVIKDSPCDVTCGDVNGDSVVDSIDALLVSQHTEQLDVKIRPEAADANCNGEIDSDDANLIIDYYSRLIDEFPCSPYE